MARTELIVALGRQRYRVERPWGDLPMGAGKVSDVACDAQGQVLVLLRADSAVDAPEPAVIRLSPQGERLAAWGAGAILDGHMLTTHPDGRVFVVDRDAHQVLAFAPDGTPLGALGVRHGPSQPFNAPCDIAFAPSGLMYVADGYGNALVHRFAAGGEYLGAWGRPGRRAGEFSTPHAIWVLPDGRVAVCDRENNRLQLFTPEGQHLFDVVDLHKPMDVHGAPEGGFYVTDQIPRLSLYSAEGKLLGRCRPVLNGAHGMWAGADGCLYLAEMNPSRVTRLVPV